MNSADEISLDNRQIFDTVQVQVAANKEVLILQALLDTGARKGKYIVLEATR